MLLGEQPQFRLESFPGGTNIYKLHVNGVDLAIYRAALANNGILVREPEPADYFRGVLLVVNETLVRQSAAKLARVFHPAIERSMSLKNIGVLMAFSTLPSDHDVRMERARLGSMDFPLAMRARLPILHPLGIQFSFPNEAIPPGPVVVQRRHRDGPVRHRDAGTIW